MNNKFLILLGSVFGGFQDENRLEYGCGRIPGLTAPTVVVMTDAHGMASEEVERLITFPMRPL